MERLTKPQGIIVHHSATRDTRSLSFPAIADYHINNQGWDDIGYHFVIEDYNGEPFLLTGRGVQYKGAHCFGLNDHIGVCVGGNYDTQELPPMLLMKLVNLLSGLIVVHDLTISDIDYHRNHANKTCPGEKFPSLEQLRALLRIWNL